MQSRSVIWVVIGLLLVVCGYLVYLSSAPRVAEGFLSTIPIEEGNLVETYTSEYKEDGVAQYTVIFSSSSSFEDLWMKYTTYVASEGFDIDETNTSREQGVIQAHKTGQIINILIYNVSESPNPRVAISYLERK